MSFYPNVNKEDMINLAKLAEQMRNLRVIEIEKKILKKTHDKELPEILEPITKKLT